jgi:hypothetical protein
MRRCPGAKIVVILRHPVQAAYSFHGQRHLLLREDVKDFETAWRLQDERRQGRHLPEHCPHPRLTQYRDVYSYPRQIERLFALVPPAQRHIIIYEEFFSDPALHYNKMLAFLGLASDGRDNFPVVNSAKRIRSKRLARFYLFTPPALKRIWNMVRGCAHAMGIHPGIMLRSLNQARTPRVELRPAFQAELAAHFAPEISSLEALLGRSLDIWRPHREVARVV